MHQFPKDIGWIEVICGSMFSGKTEELIRRVKRAVYGKQRVQVFKPQLDNRYDETQVVSHSQLKLDVHARSTGLRKSFYHLRPDTQVVGIDEVQFFGPEVVRGVRGAGAPRGCASSARGWTRTTRASPSSRCRSCWRSPST